MTSTNNPKLSKKLLGLKFMRRAFSKHKVEDDANKLSDPEKAQVIAKDSEKKCIVIVEDNPIVKSTGRFTIGKSLNKEIEKLETEVKTKDGDASVTNVEMASLLQGGRKRAKEHQYKNETKRSKR